MALLEPEARRPCSWGELCSGCQRSVLMILWCCWMLHTSFRLGAWYTSMHLRSRRWHEGDGASGPSGPLSVDSWRCPGLRAPKEGHSPVLVADGNHFPIWLPADVGVWRQLVLLGSRESRSRPIQTASTRVQLQDQEPLGRLCTLTTSRAPHLDVVGVSDQLVHVGRLPAQLGHVVLQDDAFAGAAVQAAG